jgi:hypothetical protein
LAYYLHIQKETHYKGTKMNDPKALILDDDPNSIRFLKYYLKKRFPAIQLETRFETRSKGKF